MMEVLAKKVVEAGELQGLGQHIIERNLNACNKFVST